MRTVDERRLWWMFHSAMVQALSWRLLAVWAAGLLVPSVVLVAPIGRVLNQELSLSPHSVEMARRFDALMFEDLLVPIARSGAAIGGAALVSFAMALALSPLLVGVTLAVATAPRRLRFTALLQQGLGWYGRMLRMLLVALVPLGCALALSGVASAAAGKYEEGAVLESSAATASRLALWFADAVFVVAHATVEAGRAQYLVDERLRSAWRAWWRGVRLTRRRPFAVLGLYISVSSIGFLLAAALLLLRLRVTASSGFGVVLAFGLTQLAVAAIGFGRAGRLIALSKLARAA